MSAFDKFCQEVVAMEGMISKIKNRKVRQKDAGWFQNLEKVHSIDELFTHTQNGETDKWGVREKAANVEGKHVMIEIRKDAIIDGNTVKIIKNAFANIGKVQSELAKHIVKKYNESNGKEGPWAWTETKEEFKAKSASDVTSAIKFETFTAIVKSNGVEFDFWFDDGDLWYGHVIIVSDAIDPRTGRYVDNWDYSIQG